MNYRVRPMQANDLDMVLDLERKIPEAPHWSREDYERSITSLETGLPRVGFVAGKDGNLLGFAVGKIVAGICELESIAVSEDARGLGIGAALLAAVAHWAQSAGALRIELEVRSSSERAIRLYQRFGLQREGLRPGYYQSPQEDAVLMGMSLTGGGKLA
jgi:[ribosomal protein S18]-alanine N-acetyltransferase